MNSKIAELSFSVFCLYVMVLFCNFVPNEAISLNKQSMRRNRLFSMALLCAMVILATTAAFADASIGKYKGYTADGSKVTVKSFRFGCILHQFAEGGMDVENGCQLVDGGVAAHQGSYLLYHVGTVGTEGVASQQVA